MSTDSTNKMTANMTTDTETDRNDTISNNQLNQLNDATNKQKIIKIKEGQILRYKKRLFSNNWRPAQLTLYSNASFLISTRRHPTSLLKMCKNSTLIIYGQQIEFIPKKPNAPNGHKPEHMLAIGLINHAYTYSGKLKGTQIIFYWFSLCSQDELISWVVAFQNSLFSNTSQTIKTNPDFQILTNNIALNNAANISNLDNNKFNLNTINQNDDLSLSVLMANTTAFHPTINGTSSGMAAIGAAGLLAGGAQHASIFSDNVPETFDFLSGNKLNNYSVSDTSNYYNADSMVLAGFDSGNNVSNLQSDAVPIAEIATIMNIADYLDCGIDCSAIDCSTAMDGGGDCGFDTDYAFAFAI